MAITDAERDRRDRVSQWRRLDCAGKLDVITEQFRVDSLSAEVKEEAGSFMFCAPETPDRFARAALRVISLRPDLELAILPPDFYEEEESESDAEVRDP